MSQQRYSGPGLRGRNRALTDAERADWIAATSRWHDTPQRSPQAEADNQRVRALLVALYEDAVSVPDLADAAGWNAGRLSGILHRCREAGMLSGQRRYIASARTPKQRTYRRPLTDAEKTHLVTLYNRLPGYANGTRSWQSPQAQDLLAVIHGLAGDRVALDTIAETITVTRQAVHQHLTRYRAARAANAQATALVA